MRLLLLMLLIMPYENSPYLYLGANLLGVFPDFTVIKLLGLIGFGWAVLRLASGDPMARRLSTRPAILFLMFFAGVALVGLMHGTGFQYVISRYLGFLVFLPFVLTAVRTQADLRRVLTAMVLSYVLVFPYAVRQMLRFGERLGVGLYESNYLATILVLLVPLAFTMFWQQRDPTRRKLWLGAGLLLIVMVFLTSSRGGFVGLLVAGVVFVYRRRGLASAAGVILLLLVGVFVLPTDLGARALATVFQDGGRLPPGLEVSNRAHVALFWAALRMIGDNPLFGVGPLNFKDLSTLYTGLALRPHRAQLVPGDRRRDGAPRTGPLPDAPGLDLPYAGSGGPAPGRARDARAGRLGRGTSQRAAGLPRLGVLHQRPVREGALAGDLRGDRGR